METVAKEGRDREREAGGEGRGGGRGEGREGGRGERGGLISGV